MVNPLTRTRRNAHGGHGRGGRRGALVPHCIAGNRPSNTICCRPLPRICSADRAYEHKVFVQARSGATLFDQWARSWANNWRRRSTANGRRDRHRARRSDASADAAPSTRKGPAPSTRKRVSARKAATRRPRRPSPSGARCAAGGAGVHHFVADAARDQISQRVVA